MAKAPHRTTDSLTTEALDLLDEYCDVANTLLARGVTLAFSINNGSDGTKASVVAFQAQNTLRSPPVNPQAPTPTQG